jgi:uncharacterized lipoprotein YddW (UPF0748 family)
MNHDPTRNRPLLIALLGMLGLLAGCQTFDGLAADLRSLGTPPERSPASGPAAEDRPSRAAIGPAISREEPLRGIWVTRWDYRTPDDVRTIMRNAAQAGFTDVFWQVRGQADAYYRSDLEPWGELLFRSTNDDTTRPTVREAQRGPGWDPLETAVRAAHARGLRLHAWMNVMPLWKGTDEPVDPAHPLLARTAWRLKDDRGADQPLNEHYVIVNPVLDAVHDHLGAVTRDIATRYDIDGVHLDYIRFISESLEEDRWYPGDVVSRALYRQAMGLGADAPIEPVAMRAWVRERITDLVERIADEARRARPGVMVSAAVWRRPDLAREQQLQDAPRWARMGTLDAVMPMIYDDNDAAFRSDLLAWSIAVPRRGSLVPGVGVYKHESGRQTAGQVNMHAEDDRFVLFAYSALWRSAAPGSLDTPEAESERLSRRVPLRAILRD